jgi:EAL domain-containing protein (putative c-di-GMP-specific phosphodiesterase class I)
VVIAEGIETEEQLQALVGLGVGCGQGYHLGKPASIG